MIRKTLGIVAPLVLLVALPAQATITGLVNFPGCAGGVDISNSEVYGVHAISSRVLYHTGRGNDGGSIAGNFWNFEDLNWGNSPSDLTATKWLIITSYGAAPDMGQHPGMMYVDNSAAQGFWGTVEMQPLVAPYIVAGHTGAGADADSDGRDDPNQYIGFDIRVLPVAEHLTVDAWVTPGAGCEIGGTETGSDQRVVIGYNLYRLDAASFPAATSTPDDYLNNGWVSFIPIDYGGGQGLTLETLADNAAADAFGIDGQPCDPAYDRNGDTFPDGCPTGVGNRPTPNLIFSHTGDADPGDWTYVFQPVIRGTPNEDSDGDTVDDALDVEGDGTYEFIDPSGTGLGLTYNGTILISTDSAGTSTAELPARDALDFRGSFTGRGFDLSFTASLEGQVAGYNLYRSALNDQTRFIKVNTDLIPAEGTPLTRYVYSDQVQMRRVRRGIYYYKVEAIMTDGTAKTFGPFEVNFDLGQAPRRSRTLR